MKKFSIPYYIVIFIGLVAFAYGADRFLSRKGSLVHSSTQGASSQNVAYKFPLLNKFQCNRCHEIELLVNEGVPEKSCVDCHVKIQSGYYDSRYSKAKVERWKSRVVHILRVPKLGNVSGTYRKEWFLRFIQNPKIVRPHAGVMMPQLRLSETEAQEITAIFYPGVYSPPAQARHSEGEVDAGRQLYLNYSCGDCHEFKGSGLPAPTLSPRLQQNPDSKRYAPDLAQTRERLQHLAIVEAMESSSHSESLKMAGLKVPSGGEVLHLLRLIEDLPLSKKTEEKFQIDFLALNREVKFSEVQEKVFKNVCWHCHSDPLPMHGDGGPGNTGGFGYLGANLDLSTYESVLKGSNKGSILTDVDGVPRVILHLIARHNEVRGFKKEGVLGMPLALPPMPEEDIQLLWNWIRQGAKP